MAFKNYPPGLSIQELDLYKSAFWVQIHGLPREMLTINNAERIGKVLGNLLEVDKAAIFGVTLRSYLRIRVEIDIKKPLQEG